MGATQKVLRKAFCRRSAADSEVGTALEEIVVDIGPPRKKWTLSHANYANMGGLRLGSEDGGVVGFFDLKEFTTIALNTRQFGYLQKKGVIPVTPNISEEDIEDKAKTDYFAKGGLLSCRSHG
jgi:hypothetical protein